MLNDSFAAPLINRSLIGLGCPYAKGNEKLCLFIPENKIEWVVHATTTKQQNLVQTKTKNYSTQLVTIRNQAQEKWFQIKVEKVLK